MASVEVGAYEGKSGNRRAALLRGILNPMAGWEADTTDGRSVVESLNRWEKKTIGLNRTASGMDISGGILAATVLEHSPESHQNILKQAPSNVRASYSAMRGWLREYAETLRRYDGISGSSSHQTPSTGQVPTDVDPDSCSVWILVWQERKREIEGKGQEQGWQGQR